MSRVMIYCFAMDHQPVKHDDRYDHSIHTQYNLCGATPEPCLSSTRHEGSIYE